YSRFRNPGERGAAMASALREGYADVFERNEYAHDLPREKFRDLIVEMTGLEKNNPTIRAIVGTFLALKSLPDFESATKLPVKIEPDEWKSEPLNGRSNEVESQVGLNLSYTINLNLPETDKMEVFDAIFKSLKEHILRK